MQDFAAYRRPRPLEGVLSGIVAGAFASLVMNRVQALLSSSAGDGDPATVKLADKATRALTGRALPDDAKPAADLTVHYGFGTVLGAMYGVLAEYWPQATLGGGTAFGAAVAIMIDDGVVPALGVTKPAWTFGPKTHAYAIVSHLVFGASLEATRRVLRTLMTQ